jgi:hypothetical protein
MMGIAPDDGELEVPDDVAPLPPPSAADYRAVLVGTVQSMDIGQVPDDVVPPPAPRPKEEQQGGSATS